MLRRPDNRVGSETSVVSNGRLQAIRKQSAIEEAFEMDLRPRRDSTHPLINSITNQNSAKQRGDDGTSQLSEPNEPKDPVRIFSERVTIAGLQEAHTSIFFIDKVMFRVSLFLAFLIIGYESYGITRLYWNQEAIFTDTILDHWRPPFPPTRICYTGSRTNRSRLDHWMTPLSNRTLRWARQAWPNRTSSSSLKEAIIDFLHQTVTLGPRWEKMGGLEYEATRVALRDAADAARAEGSTIWDINVAPSSNAFTNCSYYGEKFECSNALVVDPYLNTICYVVEPEHLPNTSQSTDHSTDHLSAGLTFTANTDWTVTEADADNSADDGYQLLFNQLPAYILSPLPIPTGMDAVVHLAEPIRFRERTDCVTIENAPKLQYFDSYDEEGTLCKMEAFMELTDRYLNCIFSQGAYTNENKTCMFEQFYFALLLIGGETRSSKNSSDTSVVSASIASSDKKTTDTHIEKELTETLSRATSPHSPCKPLCSRWSYPVFSSSYSKIEYPSLELEEMALANRSWSRITIILPDSSISRFEQTRQSAYYLALCDIGGTMGVYAGLSMVTVIQIITYGGYILWTIKRKKRKIGVEEARNGNGDG